MVAGLVSDFVVIRACDPDLPACELGMPLFAPEKLACFCSLLWLVVLVAFFVSGLVGFFWGACASRTGRSLFSTYLFVKFSLNFRLLSS